MDEDEPDDDDFDLEEFLEIFDNHEVGMEELDYE